MSDGKYYMYYNACEGSSPRSATGLAVSNSIEGPYEDRGIFLKSGMWGEVSPDGTVYDATKHPNAVDPDVFYDKDGKLWMVYGSYSGGIFILEIDKETGLPYEGQGYGKHLFGGKHLRIEGVFMQYSSETDYYYLFASFGDLDATGGYNLRVLRSKTPDGEFEDASGKLMSDAKATQSSFDDAAIEAYGNKVMGNFTFSNLNQSDNFNDYGYVSSGHNSTYYDEESSKYFNIFHTRFPDRGEAHEVRVHQIFLNQDGWFVVAPHRYTGETLTTVTQPEVVGGYHFVNHGNDISATIKETVYIQLNKDGSISGAVDGRWEITDDYYATLTINEEVAGKIVPVEYNGVFIKQWDESQSAYVVAFTALSNENMTIWGSQLEEIETEDLLTNLLDSITLSRTGHLYEDLTLPIIKHPSVVVEWTSSNEVVLSSTGTVIRPAIGNENIDVTLTLQLSRYNTVLSKTFDLTVMAQVTDILEDGLTAYYPFTNSLDDQTGLSGSGTSIGSQIGAEGGTISYQSGIISEAVYLDGQSAIMLPKGLISSDAYTVSLWVKPEAITAFSPVFFGAAHDTKWVSLLPKSWDENTMVWSNNEGSWYDGSARVQIPSERWSHLAFSYNQGELTLYIDGVEAFKGQNFADLFTDDQGIFTLGANYWDVPFNGLIDELHVYETSLEADIIEKLATASNVDLQSGLVASYDFNQSLEDSSNQVAAGIVTGKTLDKLSEDSLTYVEGISDDAVLLDGEHGIRLPNDLIQSNTYSVALWLKADQLTDYTTAFFGASNPENWISLLPNFREGNETVTLWSGSNTWYDGLTSHTLGINEWTHVAFTVNNGVAKVYLNGIESFSGSGFPNIFTGSDAAFSLGVNYWDVPFKGVMDDLNIYDLVLSPQQIKSLARVTSEEPGVPVEKSVVVYSFDETLAEATGKLDTGMVTTDRLHISSADSLAFEEGISGHAIVFDGAHGVRLPNNLITTSSYSLSLWIKPEEFTSSTPSFFGASSIDNWLSVVPMGWNGETLLWSKEFDNWYDGITGTLIPLNEWSHLTVTIDEGVAKVYINAEERFVGSHFPDLFTGGNAEFGLGVNYWDTPFKGLMDELSVYNYALTLEEVQSLAQLYVQSEELIKPDEELKVEEPQEQSEVEMEIVVEIESSEEVMTEIETIEEVKETIEKSQESEVEEVTADLTVRFVVISSWLNELNSYSQA